jgi:MYXO-CTERM domain-containing protein
MPMRTYTVAASLVLRLASSASAAVETREELVHETTTSVDLELTPDTVICSHADYSSTFLKVLIPQLASITLLDHQNTDAGAPCVAAGECAPFGDHAPDDILDEMDTTETVDIGVRASRVDEIDHEAQACTTTLIERVDVVIRGVPFFHQRSSSLGSRPYGDCTGGAGRDADPTDGKADGVVTDDDAPGSAGCAAGGSGGAGAGFALLVLGMAISARRRRHLSAP